MKFSLKQLAGFFLICGLVLALFLQSRHTKKLDSLLQSAYGFDSSRIPTNHYLLRTLGGVKYAEDTCGSLILRIDSDQQHLLEITHYDGNTQETEVRLVMPEDSIFAITYNIYEKSKTFSFDSIYNENIQTFSTHAFQIPGLSYWYAPTQASMPLDEGIMLTFYFHGNKAPDSGSDEHREGARDEAKIKTLCDKHKAQAVYFRIRPR